MPCGRCIIAAMRKGMVVLVLVLAFPASAWAALPKFRDKHVIPGKSIAGVSLGMRIGQATAEWGGNKSCVAGEKVEKSGSCIWTASSGTATLRYVDHKVDFIEVQVPTNNQGGPVCRGPLMNLKTSKGIGICSTLDQLAKAYPYPQFTTTGSGGVIGKGYRALSFDTTGGRFYDMYSGNLNVG
jgi:hypothetical protein